MVCRRPSLRVPDGDTVNKLVPLVVVVFLGFWMFTDTAGFVDTVQGVGGWTFDMVGQLFGKLIDVIEQW